MNPEYEKRLIELLLGKYHRRLNKEVKTSRRIMAKPTELYRQYDQNDASIEMKKKLEEAVKILAEKDFISMDYLRFSTDIEKIYLNEEKIEELYLYRQERFGIEVPASALEELKRLAESYRNAGIMTSSYAKEILSQLDDVSHIPEKEKVQKNLSLLNFLENNQEDIYIREASMLVYGDSKYFEEHNLREICDYLRKFSGKVLEDEERYEDILSDFHILSNDAEISIKGPWRIEWDGTLLDIGNLAGGISFSVSDVRKIRHISVDTECLMTIENKTSYRRMRDVEKAYLYLGGFAIHGQIEFIKKVIADNSDIKLYHFGDIDVGGFLIHRHLCAETGGDFKLYRMGIKELRNEKYQKSLRLLTDNDRKRSESLAEDRRYADVVRYMLEKNVKLEQEIISYDIVQ